MQAWLFACCCSWQLRLSTRECNPGCGYPLLLRLSGYPLLLRLSARESRNPRLLAAPTDQDTAPHPRTFTQRQQEQQLFTVRIPTKGCPAAAGPTSNPLLNQEPCSSLGCRGVIHSKSTTATPFHKLSLIIRQSRDHWQH